MSKRLLSLLLLLVIVFPSAAPYAPAQAASAPAALAMNSERVWDQAMLSATGADKFSTAAPNAEIAAVLATATQVAAGDEHTCALTSGGGVWCWGHNYYGGLGDGTTTNRITPVAVSGLASGVVGVAAGEDHTCALTSGGGVHCWGYNFDGQLGDGTTTNRSTPVAVSGLASGVVAVAAGWRHTCALTSGGGVWCWGSNGYGQLGDGTTTNRSTPVAVSGLGSGATAVAAGETHTCALTSGGVVQCWGGNDYGQLGDPTTGGRSTPAPVSGLASGVVAVAAGHHHTCALTSGGGVWCWGRNAYGQLGDGGTMSRYTPVAVSGLSSGVTAVAAGYLHTCALTSGGGIWCWGDNDSGQLGDGTTTWHPTPVPVSGLASDATAVAAGRWHTCALTDRGGVRCWGWNGYGQLGDGTSSLRHVPVEVNGLASGVTTVTAGYGHTCARTSGGGVKCWGRNDYGELGDGTSTSRYIPMTVSGLASGATAVAAGDDHTCAIIGGVGVWCWGSNLHGQLGDGTTADRSTPVAVSGLASGVVGVAAGEDHTCAVTSEGGVWCWGSNSYGKLGDGTGTQRLTPVPVSGLASGVTAVAAGDDHTCAVTSEGGVWCWGRNNYGQLGDGTTTDRWTPAPVSGLSNGVTTVTTRYNHTCALTSEGGVWCWGYNSYGRLGDGTMTHRSTPVPVSGLSSGVVAVTAGDDHTCAVTSGGGVQCWGYNDCGQLGDGTTEWWRLTPVAVSGLASGAVGVAAGDHHTCALTSEGGVQCWGSNSDGQMGVNPGWTPVDVVGFGEQTLPVDPSQSTITAQPLFMPADGMSRSTVTVQLRDANGQPAWGKTVRLSSDRGALDTITQPTAVTDGQGIATGTVRSSTAGIANISALVYEDGVILANTAAVAFEPYAPPSGEFLYRLNQMVDTALESLGYINEDAQEVAGYGDYFRTAIGEDAAKLGTDFLFGMMDIVGGVRDTRRLQKGVQLALPGMSKQLDGPFWPGILNPEQTFPAASDLFRADVWNLVRHHSIASSRSELAYGGAKFLAARARDTALEIITEKMAKQDVKNRFVYLDDGMTSSVAPAMSDVANELASLLDLTRDDLLAGLPPMTPAYQAAYEDDLTGRTRALLVLEQQLDDERRTLVNFRQAHEQHPPELANLLLRFGAKTAAEAVFDGPGTVAVGGTLLLFDSYMDGKQLNESVQMHQLAMDTLLGTPDALRQTYSNAFSAMARIGHSLPAQRATGEINSVSHWHAGRQHRSGWEETASWSEVSLTNTGDTETTFRVMAGYLADTARFGVPWATWDLVAESEIILGPRASGMVRVDYKRANGTRGLSPRSRSCFPLVGCTPACAINIQVLGTNEAGTYYIDNGRI